jgi:hypothetical protein
LSGLVELATAYIDALGERDLAHRKLEVASALSDAKKLSAFEAVEAEQGLKNAERKLALFRKIAETAKSAAEVEAITISKMFKAGNATSSQLREAEVRLHVLRAILES